MSKKSRTFTQWPPLPTKSYFPASVTATDLAGADEVRFVLDLDAGTLHEGHKIVHTVSRVLAEGSNLHHLVTEVFGITLSPGDTFELEALVGHRCRVKFAPADVNGDQRIKSIKAAKTPEGAL